MLWLFFADADLVTNMFSSVIFAFILLLRMNTLVKAMEKIKAKHKEGKTLKEQLQEGKKVTAGMCFKSRMYYVWMTLFDVAKENKAKRNAIETATSINEHEDQIAKASSCS